MSEMVNRVRDVIANAQARGFNGPEALARLAISVMREPTEAMMEAGAIYADDNAVWRAWQAMIDAAMATTSAPTERK